MPNYYCEYCGNKHTTVAGLLRDCAGKCAKHPDGHNKGPHKLYEGSEKSKYTCKYCGRIATTIASLASNKCAKHPLGMNKGYHTPAL